MAVGYANYTYDGLGNLTQTSGNAPSVPALTLSVNLANQVTSIPGVTYDGNGNVTQVGASPGTTMGYDVANRLANVTTSGGTGAYAYDSSNQRTYYRQTTSGGTTETLYIYGLDGNRLAAYGLALSGGNVSLTLTNINVYFAGKLVSAEGNAVALDGLGSVRWSAAGGGTSHTYAPYGVEYTTTTNGTEKYATYKRDVLTTLDYAVNRYYFSTWGRFMSPDPSGSSINPGNPQSWNRYSYVMGDPINHNDPLGLDGGPTGLCAAVSGLAFSAALTGPPGSCNTLALTAWSNGLDTWTAYTGTGLSQSSSVNRVDLGSIHETGWAQLRAGAFWANYILSTCRSWDENCLMPIAEGLSGG
ncbi:MAG TPA: RHS repeat-associated core domain-containing protein, partial [Bryobacteraceae bacterium]|nr:RHS repeat-associated core domain-containing protein [Bryobacteraceae bacterium]